MTGYAEMGQFLRESFNIDYPTEKKPNRKPIKESEDYPEGKKRLNESVILPRKLDYLLDTGLDERELFDALVRWLPYETLEEFAEDVTADWDIDPEYEE